MGLRFFPFRVERQTAESRKQAVIFQEAEMWHFEQGLLVPLGAFVMVIVIVAIQSMRKTREGELRAHQDLRTREMEHERKMKELEIERAKIELEKARITKSGDPVAR
jgi:flagellar biosynthesis/type III secretory pathway M-ring protein FliF/YscJ